MPYAFSHAIPEETDFLSSLERLCSTRWIFGIRHHSPACADMLVRAAAELSPSAVAIELPADLADCLPWLTHPETRTPIAIAATTLVPDSGGDPSDPLAMGSKRIPEPTLGHQAIFPFADFSPELAIARWARKNGVPIYLLDLPFASPRGLASSVEPSIPPHEDTGTQPVWVGANEHIGQEAWDSEIEAPAVGQSWTAIRRAALAVGLSARLEAMAHGGIDAQTRQREAYMRKTMATLPPDSFVVVGSFHCYGLIEHMPAGLPSAATFQEETPVDVKPSPLNPTTLVSLVPYSFAQLDSRSGYASGIRDPRWQQGVYMATASEVEQFSAQVLVEIGRFLRDDGHPTGTAEMTEAHRFATDLSRLRGLPAPGRREVIEAATSVFAQGQVLGLGRAVASALQKVMIGDQCGALPPDAPTPMLVERTRHELAELGLPTKPERRVKRIRIKPFDQGVALRRHLVLARLDLLDAGYARVPRQEILSNSAPPSYVVEPTWSATTEQNLHLVSALGVTPLQASTSLLLGRLAAVSSFEQLLGVLYDAFRCAIPEAIEAALTRLESEFLDTLSLSQVLDLTDFLANAIAGLFPGSGTLSEDTLRQCRCVSDALRTLILQLLPSIAGSHDIDDARCLGRLRGLESTCEFSLGVYLDRIKAEGSPLMQGAAHALAPDEHTSQLVGSWVDPPARPLLIGLLAALGPAWPDSPLITELIDNVEVFSDTRFVQALPHLRAVFDYTAASERERFLDRLAIRLGVIGPQLADSPQTLVRNAQLDALARQRLEALGLFSCVFDPRTRWRLILGAQPDQLAGQAADLAHSLDELYGANASASSWAVVDGRVRSSHEPGHIGVREWKGAIEASFGEDAVQTILADALERGRTDVIGFLDADSVRSSMETLQLVLSLKGALPRSRISHLKKLVAAMVEQLSQQLKSTLVPALASYRQLRTSLRDTGQLAIEPTLRRNLTHLTRYRGRPQIIPVHPRFFSTVERAAHWHIIVVVDVSGSMEPSAIFAALTAAILSGVKTLRVSFVAFNTEVIDLSESAGDALELLLEISFGGGTDIAQGLRYAESLVSNPTRTAIILVTDFHEFGSITPLADAVGRLAASGVRLLGVAALNDEGNAAYNKAVARVVAGAGMRIASLTPLQLVQWVGDQLR